MQIAPKKILTVLDIIGCIICGLIAFYCIYLSHFDRATTFAALAIMFNLGYFGLATRSPR